MALDFRNIIVQLNNVPVAHRNPEVERRLCARSGEVLEVNPPKWGFYQPVVKVRNNIIISEPLTGGTYRLGDGTRRWI